MCGIVGAWMTRAGMDDIADVLVEGLRTLEYRGYDSSGVGVVRSDPGAAPGAVRVARKMGRLENLEEALKGGALAGANVGVGHTRWATHGEPSDENAHPHTDGTEQIALVHNGIIENYLELRAELEAAGVVFQSETDTEVLTHLVGRRYATDGDLAGSLRAALRQVKGYYAVAVVGNRDGVTELVCARQGPPLCVAMFEDGVMLASDVLAVLPHTREVTYLSDGDLAVLSPGSVRVERIDGEAGEAVERVATLVDWDTEAANKGGYPHFMLKEIFEQSEVLGRAIHNRLLPTQGDVQFEGDGWSDPDLNGIGRVQILACGTALHAGIVARYLIEGLARIPVEVDFASEYRYCEPVVSPGTLAIAISQSGETADTLAAMRLARELGAQTLAICNVQGSTLTRDCQKTILTHAGPEIGVASTKAFTAQLIAAYLFALRLGRARRVLDEATGARMIEELRHLRPKLESLLTTEFSDSIRKIAERHVNQNGFLFLGRGVNYPIALEGALKLKEISYVHAEGYAAGEMKHGPIALIDPGLTTLVINTKGRVADKVRSGIEQVRARKGPVIVLGSDEGSWSLGDDVVKIPETSEWLSPLLHVVPLQLFAYHVADLKGCDIDKPRNLAKSVTVE
ncbi:MAG: glutamine--fructose-6-phosphate transaminase (isomerizing) [Planctomycetota bacterium]|nr:glutamine--fructose-6-phosphate transaminase (isomerizing) [Planctomycetota bacterium]